MTPPRVVAIIPARMASTRYPGKPLAPIHGVPMIGHCYFRTRLSRTVDETWVATCDREIFDYIRSVGGQAVMTKDSHERCSDRCAEAMLAIEAQTGKRIDIVAMVQGDEPMVWPDMIDDAVKLLIDDPACPIACLMADIDTEAEFEDPNCVKVVADAQGRALYFSREPIPSRRKGARNSPRRRQVPIIPFRRDYLLRFNELKPTPLEIAESVDLMRCVEHGDPVKLSLTTRRTVSVDTPADLARAEAAMANDPLTARYAAGAAAR
ncbi:MAG: 3-deoxy-manno-octulosonate cytidylyltransferase [Elusimicrobiota bacterium]